MQDLLPGILSALRLGILTSISPCPLSIQYDSQIIVPALYGWGTGIPVIVFAGIIAYGAQSVGRAFNIITQLEWWFRRITGIVLIGLGIYFSLKYIFRLF